jgi:peptidoglycan pentaglycine glycine transferase (the first glycine)
MRRDTLRPRNVRAPCKDVNASEALISPAKELVCRESVDAEDPPWDAFLETTAQGHFQQSSMWARAKSIEGWRPIRVQLFSADDRVGGFQVLARKKRLGNIGYISKGPVLVDDDARIKQRCLEEIVSCCKRNRLQALIVQAPDHSSIQDDIFVRHRFVPNRLVGVIKATMCIDLSGSLKEVEAGFRKTARVELRQAERRGITIREGTEKDAGVFFRLMAATCERQGSLPSPASEASVLALWKAFSSRGRIRVTFAEYAGEPVAAALCLILGSRVTLWKKGWSGAQRERHPNQLVTYEAIRWAHENGYRLFDCAGMAQSTAMSLLHGEPLSDAQKQGRDFFLLGYGAKPLLLPESWVYFRNPIIRFAYSKAVSSPWLAKITRRFAR